MPVDTADVARVSTEPGELPDTMAAWVIRQEREGLPRDAFQIEEMEVPEPGAMEVVVRVMAAGVNYNNVWAARGRPVDVIAGRRGDADYAPFHVGGSDASGVVQAVAPDVTDLRPGDEVVVHCGTWRADCPHVRAGGDPVLSPTFRVWGYETNWGSFAQFAKVQRHQCLPKPPRLTWEAAACYMLTGATAYRMLLGRRESAIARGDVVLVWGGSGGLGSMAIQLARHAGAIPVAVVSSEARGAHCVRLGASGYIDRRRFTHWGPMPHWSDGAAHARWLEGARAFGRAVWDVVGERRSPRLVFEHPGEDSLPTSMFVCAAGGTVVICAGTTGYQATLDLRHLWMRQKRLQGSHFADDAECAAFNRLVADGEVDPCLGRVFAFDEIPLAHRLVADNAQGYGNAAALVGAPEAGVTYAP
jgi:crotonyl-CoA carboxylase/reductase